MLRFILNNIDGHRNIFFITIILSIIEGLLSTLSIAALIPLMSSLIGNDLNTQPWPISLLSIIDLNIKTLIFSLSIILLIKVFISLASTYVTATLKRSIWKEWANKLTRWQLNMSHNDWVNQDSGKLISLISRELLQSTSFLTSYISMLTHFFSFITLLIAMFIIDWRLVLVAIVIFSIIYYVGLRPLNRFAVTVGKRSVIFSRSTARIVSEIVEGVRDFKLFKAKNYALSKLNSIISKLTDNEFHHNLIQAIPKNSIELLLAISFLVFSKFFISNEQNDFSIEKLPTVLFFITGFARLSTFGGGLSTLYVKAQKRFPSFEAVTNITSKETNYILNYPNNLETIDDNNNNDTKIKEKISLSNITFFHKDKVVLNKICLDLPINTATILYGDSGSGKSTIADIISRLYKPNSGLVLLDGKDASKIIINDWRNLIGYVSSEPLLFSASINENLRLGYTSPSQDDIIQSLNDSGVLSFINGLKKGINTVLVDKGRNISVGQRCRLAIARALLRNPSLLILDETLDRLEISLAEEILLQLKKKQDLSILIISHRNNWSNFIDQILKIDQGTVIVKKPYNNRKFNR
jgi:ABC-type bacteriocin/lantibiotic exporter with double-glycine peptidase domain